MGESYITIFANSALAQGNPMGPVVLFFLFLTRMLPIIAMAPFLGARILPHPVKVTFAISLFVIFLPRLLLVTTTPLAFNMLSIVLFAKELVVGMIIGFMISIPFSIVQSAGMYIDHQRGGASLMVNDPTIQNQSSPLGTMFNFVLIYLFFLFDGPFLFFEAILESYELVPPDQFINPNFFHKDSESAEIAISLLNTVIKIAVKLASPALITILMTDVFLGIANRLAPQVQITFLGLPLKSLLGLTVICIGWKPLTTQMVHESQLWLKFIEKFMLYF